MYLGFTQVIQNVGKRLDNGSVKLSGGAPAEVLELTGSIGWALWMMRIFTVRRYWMRESVLTLCSVFSITINAARSDNERKRAARKRYTNVCCVSERARESFEHIYHPN